MTTHSALSVIAVIVWLVLAGITWAEFAAWVPRHSRGREWWRTFNRLWMCALWPLTLPLVWYARSRNL